MKWYLVLLVLICSKYQIQAQNKILMFVAQEDTYYSEYIVMFKALQDAGYIVDVRSVSPSLQASTYMIPNNTTIDATAATLPGGSYGQFTAQYMEYFGAPWDSNLNNISSFIPTDGSILQVSDMNEYVALVVVGGTGALSYIVDGNYSTQGVGMRTISADSVRMVAEKLNALAIQALSQGKPILGQCHGAAVPAYWRYPVPVNALPAGLGNSILNGNNATGFPEAATAPSLASLGINYRELDPVVVSTPHNSVPHNGNGDYKIITTRDWYPQTVAHAARTLINIIESYPSTSVMSQNTKVLILHGGAVNNASCLYTNRSNDIPCNYGSEMENLPADYLDLVSLLNADSSLDEYNFTVSDVHLTSSLPFDNTDFCAIYQYLMNYNVVLWYKHWSTGVTVALQNAIVAFADNGGGVVSLHHGLYNDLDPGGLNKNILVNQLFNAESAMNTWSANRTTYNLMSTNYGHFVSSYGITNHLNSQTAPGPWSTNNLPIAANTGYSYYQRISLFDEIYNNMAFVGSPSFGRNLNNITPLFSNNLTPTGQCHTAGFMKKFDQNLDSIFGKIVYLQTGETKANYVITHPYGQTIRNAMIWAKNVSQIPFPKVYYANNTNSGTWHQSANWSPSRIPLACDQVIIPSRQTPYDVILSGGNSTVRSVSAGTNANIIIHPPYELIIKE